MKRAKILLAAVATLFVCNASAQTKSEVAINADLVSSYIWRGTECGGVSIQPGLTYTLGGFSAGAWGSVGFEEDDSKEFDLFVSYSFSDFSVGYTDYFFDSYKYGYADSEDGLHVGEINAGYDCGKFSLAFNINVWGDDDNSMYIEAGVPFKVNDTEMSVAVGMTPDKGMYAEDCNVTNVSLRADHEVLKLPAFAQVTFNPAADAAFLVFGVSF